MWMPGRQDFAALQVVGLFTITLALAVPRIAALRRHARGIGLTVTVLYLLFGFGYVIWRSAG